MRESCLISLGLIPRRAASIFATNFFVCSTFGIGLRIKNKFVNSWRLYELYFILKCKGIKQFYLFELLRKLRSLKLNDLNGLMKFKDCFEQAFL